MTLFHVRYVGMDGSMYNIYIYMSSSSWLCFTNEHIGRRKADETYSRYASLSTAAARHDLSSVYFRRVQVFLPSPFVFHVGPFFDFKGGGRLVDCVSPVRSQLSTAGN